MFQYVIVILLLIINRLPVYGQSISIKSVVVDAEGGSPIPYSNVAILGSYRGTFSDEKGLVRIEGKTTDTLAITSTGYNGLKFPWSLVPDTIRLTQKITSLQEVVVRSEKPIQNPIKETIGFYKNKKDGIYTGFKQAGLRINNKLNRQGWITSIQFKLGHLSNFYHTQYQVRLRILSIGLDGLPNEDLFYTENPIKVKRNQKKVKLQLNDKGVIFPKKGCFLVLEFLGHIDDKGHFIPYDNSSLKNSYHFAPAFSMKHDYQLSWIGGGTKWKAANMSIKGQGYINFNFGIEVEYD